MDDVEYNLEIVDTAGQEEFASFRDSSLDYGVCKQMLVTVCVVQWLFSVVWVVRLLVPKQSAGL